jgi:hypothetical protein
MPSKSDKPKPDKPKPSNPLASKATFRDMFAAAALQALVATSRDPRVAADLLSPSDVGESLMSAARHNGWSDKTNLGDGNSGPFTLAGLLASDAYELADAMLAEREKER